MSSIGKDAVAAGAKFFVKRRKRDFPAGFQAINNPGAIENFRREEGTKACFTGVVEGNARMKERFALRVQPLQAFLDEGIQLRRAEFLRQHGDYIQGRANDSYGSRAARRLED